MQLLLQPGSTLLNKCRACCCPLHSAAQSAVAAGQQSVRTLAAHGRLHVPAAVVKQASTLPSLGKQLLPMTVNSCTELLAQLSLTCSMNLRMS
jgi:hypothetical protein